MDQSNIIPFPKLQTKRVRRIKRINQERSLRRTMVATSIVSVVFVVTLMNASFTGQAEQSPVATGRGPASVGASQTRDVQLEKRLIKKLSQYRAVSEAELSSIAGDKPNLAEKLQFEVLAGNYDVVYKDQQVKEITMSQTSTWAEPQKIENPQDLITKYKALFGSDIHNVAFDRQQDGLDQSRTHFFRLESQAADQSKTLALKLDAGGHLLWIKQVE